MTTDFIKVSKEIVIKVAKNMEVTSEIEQHTSGRRVIILIDSVITFV